MRRLADAADAGSVPGARGTSLEIRMGIQLTGNETCNIDALLSMARFYP